MVMIPKLIATYPFSRFIFGQLTVISAYNLTETVFMIRFFQREPLCYQAGVYQALKWAVGIDIFTADDTVSPADFSWRSHTKDNPVTKALVLTAADEFRSTDVNEDNIESYLDAIHDVTHGGFDKIFTVGKIDENRARSSEVNFWRDLNEIACRNPQV